MTGPQTTIDLRRPYRAGESLFLLGPGGVGKSSLGAALAPMMGWTLIDLDLVFCAEVGIIGPFIAAKGYAAYRAQNLALARRIVRDTSGPAIVVTSSGFLAAPRQSADRKGAEAVVGSGFGLTLLPSADLETAMSVVVPRQLTRGFGFAAGPEAEKFRQRFPLYRDAGDALVLSVAPPSAIALAVKSALSI